MAQFTQAEVDDRIYTAGVDVYVEEETFLAVGQNTWVSPTTAQLTGQLQDKFTYNGSLVYAGLETIKVIVIDNSSISLPGSGASGEIEITNAYNGVPCPIGIMPCGMTLGRKEQVSTVCIFTLNTGDTIDFNVRQTSEAGGSDITIHKGRYTVLKIG